MAVIDRVVLKGRRIVMLTSLQQQILEQLHSNHMGLQKKWCLLACVSIYWPNINENWKGSKKLSKMSWISADVAKGKKIMVIRSLQVMGNNRHCYA